MWKISLSWIFAVVAFGQSGQGFDAVARGLAHGTVVPTTCSPGQIFFKTDATAGQNIYECAATNTYTQQLNSGGSPITGATTNAIVTAASATTLQTPSSGATVDSSGNLKATTLSSGGSTDASCDGTAGCVILQQGTQPSGLSAANGIQHVAPNSVTAYRVVEPGTAASGLPLWTNAANVITESILALGSNVGTFLTTPSSANLAAAITDETGTGAAVFANTPTLVTPILGAATGTSLALGGSTNACTGGTAGCGQFDQGTAPSGLPANGIQDIAPTSVTSYRDTRPGTVGSTGVDLVSVSGTVATHTYGPLTASLIPNTTASNCSNAASPAVCGSAAAGAVALPTGITSVNLVVNTSLVTANSEIFLQSDDSLTIAATTCNSTLATLVGGLAVTARTPGTSFTITYNGTIATNPLCVAYRLVN